MNRFASLVVLAVFSQVGSSPGMAVTTTSTSACIVFSGADMTGTSTALPADNYDSRVGQPAFTPKSIFVAGGYAARIYSGMKFQGDVKLIGGAADLAGDLSFSHIHTTAGGHYLNLAEVWPGAAVASYSCVAAGTLVKLPAGSIAQSIVTYGDKEFYIDRFMNIHGNSYKITITSQAVTVRSVQQDSGYGAQVVLDLGSGDITLTNVEHGVPNPTTSLVAKRPSSPSTADLSLAYIGAVKLLLKPVTASAFNNQSSYPSAGFFPEANPELNEVLNLLSNYNFSL